MMDGESSAKFSAEVEDYSNVHRSRLAESPVDLISTSVLVGRCEDDIADVVDIEWLVENFDKAKFVSTCDSLWRAKRRHQHDYAIRR